jgi:hypothetical protein
VPTFKPDPGEMRRVWGAIRECARSASNLYAGTASFSFFAASISFWAMCAGTSS